MKNVKKWLVTGFLLGSFLACRQDADEASPFLDNPVLPNKVLISDNKTLSKGVLFVDVKRCNPLNAAAYTLAAENGKNIPFFDYVILSSAYVTKNQRGYTVVMLPAELEHILENAKKYIRPLHEKGIKVLIELRSGNFTDDEEGVAAGFGTMDMARIDEFVKELKRLVDKYGIDGFDFNDIGGGTSSYSPGTRYIKQFQSNEPLYKDKLFVDAAGDPLPLETVKAVLWREGGSNFSNVIQRTNEALKEEYTNYITAGDAKDPVAEPGKINRTVMVHYSGHGEHLFGLLRMAYMPDAYTGADPTTLGNVQYVVYDGSWDDSSPKHVVLYDTNEAQKTDAAKDTTFAPFTVDLENRVSNEDAEAWAAAFVQGDSMSPDGAGDNYKYGGLVFRNLPPASASADIAAYVSIFSQALFGKNVTVQGSAAYTKDW
jgi:hypothetical protein